MYIYNIEDLLLFWSEILIFRVYGLMVKEWRPSSFTGRGRRQVPLRTWNNALSRTTDVP